MTEEEKKAIEIIKFLQNKCIQENGTGMMPIYRIDDLANAIKILLNLIEKQSKEIEELKEENKKLTDEYLVQRDLINPDFLKDYINKDKIKAKIEEFKTVRDTILKDEKEFNRPMMTYDLKRNDYCEKMLQSLLEKE